VTRPIVPSLETMHEQARAWPSAIVALMHAWTRSESGSVHNSDAGRPMMSMPDKRAMSDDAAAQTSPVPRNNAMTPIGSSTTHLETRPVPADGLPIVQQSTRDCRA
jgi:hypothetical protein